MSAITDTTLMMNLGTTNKMDFQLTDEEVEDLMAEYREYGEFEEDENIIRTNLKKVRRIPEYSKIFDDQGNYTYDQYYNSSLANATDPRDILNDLYNQASARMAKYLKYGDTIWDEMDESLWKNQQTKQ